MMRCGRQMRWLEGVWLALRAGPAGEYSGRVRRWFLRMWWRFAPVKDIGKRRAFGSVRLGGAAVKAHPKGFSMVSETRLIPARDFFLEKKQKRAWCSGLPSRFILCRTCRAKAACLGGISVCIPRAAGAACPSCTVRHARTRLWPYACAHRGRVPRERWARGGQQMRRLGRCGSRFAPAAGVDGGRCATVVSEGVVALRAG